MANGKSNRHIIDRLGELKAKIAELQTEEKALRDEVIALGVGAHEGDLFRATVTESERATLDMAAVREKLSPQFITAHTTVTEVITVKVTSRKAV